MVGSRGGKSKRKHDNTWETGYSENRDKGNSLLTQGQNTFGGMLERGYMYVFFWCLVINACLHPNYAGCD